MEKRKEGDLFLRGDFSSLLFTAHNAQLLLFIIIMAPTTAQKLLAAYNGFYGRTTTTSFFFHAPTMLRLYSSSLDFWNPTHRIELYM